MPIYEFKCRKCETQFEEIRPLGDDGKSLICPECGTKSPKKVPSVFAAGSDMAALWNELPTERRGGYAETADALQNQLLEAIAPGDVIMVKGSNASRLGPLVATIKALKKRVISWGSCALNSGKM